MDMMDAFTAFRNDFKAQNCTMNMMNHQSTFGHNAPIYSHDLAASWFGPLEKSSCEDHLSGQLQSQDATTISNLFSHFQKHCCARLHSWMASHTMKHL